jgi:hypothetical protein
MELAIQLAGQESSLQLEHTLQLFPVPIPHLTLVPTTPSFSTRQTQELITTLMVQILSAELKTQMLIPPELTLEHIAELLLALVPMEPPPPIAVNTTTLSFTQQPDTPPTLSHHPLTTLPALHQAVEQPPKQLDHTTVIC